MAAPVSASALQVGNVVEGLSGRCINVSGSAYTPSRWGSGAAHQVAAVACFEDLGEFVPEYPSRQWRRCGIWS